MRICIVGVGAVGGYFGGRLAAAGTNVVFLARGATLTALRERGLEITGVSGHLSLPDVDAVARAEAVGPVDAVILGVKAWQVAEVAGSLGPLLRADTAILPLQNGIDAPRELCEAVGAEHVLGGTCRIVAHTVAPGRIEHLGVEPSIALGELDDSRSDRVIALAGELQRSGVATVVPASIHSAIWQKFLFIAAVSGVGAITRAPIGVLRSRAATRELLVDAMGEVARLAAAAGIPLAADLVERTMGFVDSLPADATASMQRDIAAGRPSELEEINGAVVRLGHELGVPTPVHRVIHAALTPAEATARRASV